jgi:crossover junction endodeoxyribonuclease RuvC
MIVLGVDPGSVRTGWGVIERRGPRLHFIAAGTIDAGRDSEMAVRLCEIHAALQVVIARHAPVEMAIEDVFHAKFARSAIKLGQARGIALLAGAQAGLPIAEYAPALVKRSVAGRGQADKQQVARIVGAILGLRELPNFDATDALAIAITHAQAMLARNLAKPARVSRERRVRG